MSNDSTKSFVIDGITYTASPLSETRWSVRVEDPDECDAINNGPVNWADVDAVSEALGVPVRFIDGGDHPTAIESIYEIAKINWRELMLYSDDDGELSVDRNPAAFRTALTEYRETGAMGGVWMVDTTGMTPEEVDDAADAGPSVDEIDWTGFARVSVDNGRTFAPSDEQIVSHWGALTEAMDNDTREEVHSAIAPCSEVEFLAAYLLRARRDLVIG